jgi:hypothetical protein
MMSNSALSFVACVLVGIACSPRPAPPPDDPFPSTVGPPYGLSALHGGMSRQQVTAALASDGANQQLLDLALRASNRSIESALSFDHDRLGDIAFEVRDCAETNRLLRSKWGQPATTVLDELVWERESSHWVADVVIPERPGPCVFSFTSKDYFGSAPNAALVRFEPGISRDTASRIDADLAKATTAIPLPGIAQAFRVATFRGDRVESTYLVLPARALVALRAAWGRGATFDAGARTVWLDADTRWRATLVDRRVIFDKAMRWEAWLGDGPLIQALGSVVGRPLAELRRERGDALLEESDGIDKRTHYSMRIPAEEWDPDSTSTALLRVDHDVVSSATVTLRYTTPAVRDRMLRQFGTKWGAATATKPGVDFRVAGTNIHVVDLGTELQIDMVSS